MLDERPDAVLLNVAVSNAEPFLREQSVDRIETYLMPTAVTGVTAAELAPSGYRLTAVEKVQGLVRVSSEREH